MQYHVVSVTPTIDTNIYASGDQLGSLMTITAPSSGLGSGCRLEKIVIVDKAKQSAALKVLLFNASPTVTSVDNAAADVSDSEMGTKSIGAVSVAAGDYVALNVNSVATVSPSMAVKPTAGANALYALLVSAGTPTYGATSDLVVQFTFSWE